jgi:hypothetical protein
MHRASAEFIDEIINKLGAGSAHSKCVREQLSRASFTLSTFEQALEEDWYTLPLCAVLSIAFHRVSSGLFCYYLLGTALWPATSMMNPS